MRLSEAIVKQEPKELEVPFDGGAVLKVEYTPAKFTVRELEAMQKNRDVRAVIKQILRVITKWDLEGEDGKTLPLEEESLLDIDITVFTRIITKVSEDQRASGEAESS